MPHTRYAALVLTAFMLAATGCGGSTKPKTASGPTTAASGPTTTSEPTSGLLTQAEMIAKTNAICGRLATKLNSSKFQSTQEFLQLAPHLTALERSTVADLRKLTPPSSLAYGWKQAILSIQTLADNTDKAIQYLKSARTAPNRVGALISANVKTRAPMLAAAGRAGFRECTQIY
jgi:hypothetical protein